MGKGGETAAANPHLHATSCHRLSERGGRALTLALTLALALTLTPVPPAFGTWRKSTYPNPKPNTNLLLNLTSATGFRDVEEEHERAAAQVSSGVADVHRSRCWVDDARRSPTGDVGLPHRERAALGSASRPELTPPSTARAAPFRAAR